jgi:hypothetical protein
MWLLRIITFVVAVLCFTIGLMATVKSCQVLKSGLAGRPGIAVRVLVCGIALIFFGFFLIYTIFTF